ncbi:MAG: phosphate/phosphite/phosphonate ABC transporter substrate-binding protein [Candidatus Dadabacteria bacterium]|nr:MAG: phosphate/phosphite/phosphonate ABC transporter substrate-binding protein [Candidatus Dadabacteria bacterium]
MSPPAGAHPTRVPSGSLSQIRPEGACILPASPSRPAFAAELTDHARSRRHALRKRSVDPSRTRFVRRGEREIIRFVSAAKTVVAVLVAVAAAVPACRGRDEVVSVDPNSDRVVQTREARAGGEAIRFAVAPVLSPEKAFPSYRLLTQYLSHRLKTPVELVQRKTYLEVNEMLRRGAIQFALICTGAYVVGEHDFGLELVAVPRYQGKLTYQSLLVVRRDSSVQNVEDLRGRPIALSDPLSNSGYFYPIYLIRSLGEDPRTFFGRMFFTYSHDSSMLAVQEGIADAAAVDSLIFEYEIEKKPELRKAFRIIHRSPPYGINPVVAATNTPAPLVQRFRDALLSMSSDSEGRRVLELLRLDEFTRPPPDLYDSARRMILSVALRDSRGT